MKKIKKITTDTHNKWTLIFSTQRKESRFWENLERISICFEKLLCKSISCVTSIRVDVKPRFRMLQ